MKKLGCLAIALMCLLALPKCVGAEESQAECPHSNTELCNELPASSNPAGGHIPGYTGDIVCLDFGQILEWGTEISPASKVIVKSVTYTGKAQKPAVSVYNTNGEKIKSQFYKITY